MTKYKVQMPLAHLRLNQLDRFSSSQKNLCDPSARLLPIDLGALLLTLFNLQGALPADSRTLILP